MINLNKKLKRILRSALLGIIVGGVLCLPGTLTYACLRSESPNVLVTIDKKGNIGSAGTMFSNGLWYPGKRENGTIRIYNEFKRIKVTDMDVQMKLLKWKTGYTQDVVENSFLRNMKLSVKKEKNLFQNQLIIDNQCLYNLVKYFGGRMSGKAYHLEDQGQFHLDKGDFTDLYYSLEMLPEAGNELQDLSANVGVNLTFEER